ncbi:MULTISPECIES: hypothetical protein [Okeania]|uniref:hypothetical protein n=1 Tax=Okeania TaxID=1458928 RepID=UPI001374E38C|nr:MULTISPECIES: hypothetical protein [Okeania]NET14508.1 hypothetical protein [Okeania sp. SIO1H6]NET79068.1 hypothetical protein [Okeania sp. SIO1F9]
MTDNPFVDNLSQKLNFQSQVNQLFEKYKVLMDQPQYIDDKDTLYISIDSIS